MKKINSFDAEKAIIDELTAELTTLTAHGQRESSRMLWSWVSQLVGNHTIPSEVIEEYMDEENDPLNGHDEYPYD